MNYYNEIKQELINNEINRKVKSYAINKSDLNTYYNVGRILSATGKYYGEGIIKKYSSNLIGEVNKKYNETNLKRMRQFYQKVKKGATLWHQLSWSHYRLLIALESIDEINYYSKIAVENLYSVRELEKKIKNREYQRLPEETRNKLISCDKMDEKDLVKNPIMIQNNNSFKLISERTLQKLILEDIPSFLKELGQGFTFIENEYKIKIENRYNYIDLLLFNYEYNCFIVVELKITELKKEYIGQIQVYMHYIDDNLKRINQDKTIGIIICKKDNQYIMEYCSDDRILTKEYELA